MYFVTQILNMKKITIEELKKAGYDLELTLQKDCFYCAFTDAIFPLESFKIENEYDLEVNGVSKKVKTVNSTEFNLKGYCVS